MSIICSIQHPGNYCLVLSGERWWIGCWSWGWAEECLELVLDFFGFTFIASIRSNASKTSFIEGRLLGSGSRHFKVSCAAWSAALGEYWPSIRTSMMVFSFLFEDRHGLVQSTRLCCPLGRFVSSARKPVSSSSSTTPKPYTSLFTYKWPVEQHKRQAWSKHIIWFTQWRIIKDFIFAKFIITCGNVFRSCITVGAHNPSRHMRFSTRWPQFC